jgi:general stress protein 26
MDVRTDQEAVDKVHALIKKARLAMFGTYDLHGTCHARPMAAIDHDEGALWFTTHDDSRKIREIASDPRVSIQYADTDGQNYVSVTGCAREVRDRAKIEELWMEPLRTWFPEGKDDPHVTLIHVDLETAEYWDSPSGVIVHTAGYLKALATGEPPAPGDVSQVKM